MRGRRLKRLRVVVVVAPMVAAMVVISASSASHTDSQQAARTLVVAVTSTPDGLDPAVHFSIGANQAQHSLYAPLAEWVTTRGPGGLIVPNFKSGIVRPYLAQSFRLSNGGRTLTVTLKRGIISPYGNEMTANDLQWTWDRGIVTPGEHQFQIQTVLGMKKKNWRVIDKYTWQVTTPFRNAILLYEMAMQKFGIVYDSTEAKKHATSDDQWATRWLARNAAGYGPYQVQSYTPGTSVVLVRNTRFRLGPRPYFDRIELRQVPSSSNRATLVQTGAVDVAQDIPPRQLNRLKNVSSVTVWSTAGNLVTRLGFNLEKEPFTDKRVRQALLYATPVNDILGAVYFGFARNLRSPIPATFPGYTPRFWNYNYNPARARALLQQAGVREGTPLTLYYDAGSDVHRDLFTILKTAYDQIGFNVRLSGQPDATFFGKVSRGVFSNFVYENFPIIGDPAYGLNIAYPCTAPFNPEHYCNRQVDALIRKAQRTASLAKRIPIYHEIQRLIVGDAPEVWLAMPGWQIVTKRGITGVNWNGDNAPTWARMRRS